MSTQPQAPISYRRKFRTKLILVAGASVVIGLLLTVGVSLYGLQRLGDKSSEEIERGLKEAYIDEYLHKYIADTSMQTNRMLSQAMAEVTTLAGITQRLFDAQQDLVPIFKSLSSIPSFQDRLTFNPTGGWFQNGSDEPTVVSVWPYLLDDDKQIRPDVIAAVERTTILDAILPAFQTHGTEKVQTFYVGPEDRAFVRVAPYQDVAGEFFKAYPEHHSSPFWSFFFPKMVETWEHWAKLKVKYPTDYSEQSFVTLTPPYADAVGNGLVMSVFYPIWDAQRLKIDGAVGLDIKLDQIVNYIESLQLKQEGFAFLSKADGNVFALNEDGVNTLALTGSTGDSKGVSVLERKLTGSPHADVRNLKLPEDDKVHFSEVNISGKVFYVVLRRLDALNVWQADKDIIKEYWTIGYVVPKDAILASLYASQATISDNTRNIITGQIFIAIGTLFLVLVGVTLVSRRMTASIVSLAAAANEIMRKNYDVWVMVRSEDEIGQLAGAFNNMANEIRKYTLNLEDLVRQRTRELERANQEIMALNDRLKQENLRLGAELDVARRLQLMVLPSDKELSSLKPSLDVAGYMKPADEVGGDYYDVIHDGSSIKISIGDVTGHGLESGVLMLMVQTALRTLIASEERDPQRLLTVLNRVVFQNVQRSNLDRNLTLSILDYKPDGSLTLTGQHEELIVVRSSGDVERIDTMALGFPVGLEFDIEDFLSSTHLRLASGDVAVLYTDGIPEAENEHKEQYGIDRLCQVIRNNHQRSANQIKDAIVQNVMGFIGKQKVFDDITVVVLKQP